VNCELLEVKSFKRIFNKHMMLAMTHLGLLSGNQKSEWSLNNLYLSEEAALSVLAYWCTKNETGCESIKMMMWGRDF